MRKLAILALSVGPLAVALGAMSGWTLADRPQDDFAPGYVLAPVEQREAVKKVLAIGTVQPAASVVVGSQLSGQVIDVLVDHNDAVTANEPVARLDPQLFETMMAQARSDVSMAENALAVARAAAEGADAAFVRAGAERDEAEAVARRVAVAADSARRVLERKTRLARSGSGTETETEDAEAAYEIAVAETRAAAALVAAREAQVSEAAANRRAAIARVAHAEAELGRSHAALQQAEADLARTVIRAPADGIVIARSVSPGQTVAASLQAPSLFTIGNLDSVAVELVIDEADIGRIRVGQQAGFTVDAYPGRVFEGEITQVRRAPHIEDTVVTYTAILSAGNPELALFPGMTAMAEIVIGRNPDALQVPAAALRYSPPGIARPSGSHVWVLSGDRPLSVPVQVGVDSAGMIEVGGDLREGQPVIIEENAAGPGHGPVLAGLLSWLGQPGTWD